MISGVILAGGKGRRMGGIDKGLMRFHGRPLVAHVAERLQPQVDELVINANQNLDQYAAMGYPLISDHIPCFVGPLAGLHAALTTTRHDWVVTVPCDSPFLPTDLVARLHEGMQRANVRVAIAKTFDQIHPVFCLCQRTALAHLSDFLVGGGRRFQQWIATLDAVEVPFDEAPEAFENLNTREDLARAEISSSVLAIVDTRVKTKLT